MILRTARLRLQPFEPAHLLALIDGERRFEESSGLRAANGLREFLGSGEVSPEWLARVRASEIADPWIHGFAIIGPQGDVVIGSVGFRAPPADDGTVEFAYGLVPDFQGKGYATEAAAAVVGFAFASGRVQLMRAHTLGTNTASMRVLAKCGFTRTGEVVDPDDGLVWRWERSRPSD